MKLKIVRTPGTDMVSLVDDEMTITGDNLEDAIAKAKEFFGEDIEIEDAEHKCTLHDMEYSDIPIRGSECVSFEVKCKVCGKVREEVYTLNEGLYDEETQDYIFLGLGG